jgi:predicted nuclease of restriction endonuclease-like (RecB) superfamily
MSLKERWSFRELQRQIDSAYFERFILSQQTDRLIKIEQDKLAVPLSTIHLEFLDLSDTFSERELRKSILGNLRDFFLEFGKNFCFVGEEYPLIVDDEEYRIDLLFFQRELKCLIPIELKIGEFKPEYVGKMQFYLNALDEKMKLPNENQSIGLILCRSAKKSVVRLTLSESNKSMKISVYQMNLPDKKLIQQRLDSIKIPKDTEIIELS